MSSGAEVFAHKLITSLIPESLSAFVSKRDCLSGALSNTRRRIKERTEDHVNLKVERKASVRTSKRKKMLEDYDKLFQLWTVPLFQTRTQWTIRSYWYESLSSFDHSVHNLSTFQLETVPWWNVLYKALSSCRLQSPTSRWFQYLRGRQRTYSASVEHVTEYRQRTQRFPMVLLST